MHSRNRSRPPFTHSARSSVRSRSLVVGPHAQDMHDALLGEDLVDKAALNVDPSRVTPGEVADQFSKRGGFTNESAAMTSSNS